MKHLHETLTKLRYFLSIALLVLLIAPTAVLTPPIHAQETNPPTVHAVLFWSETCPHCHVVIDNVLPPLQAQYGDQLQIHLIQISSNQGFDQLIQIAAEAGVPRSGVGVPFMLIGDAVLVGSGQIPAELPGLIESHLAAGGVAYPDYPSLTPLLPASSAAPATSLGNGENSPPIANDGFALAIMIIIGMILALGYTAVRLYPAFHTQPSRKNAQKRAASSPAWLQYAFLGLALVGLGVAGYLAYVETQAVTAVCGPVGDCNAVQTSEYAYLFGIPIGVLGVVGYLAILAVWAWQTWRPNRSALLTLLGMTIFGVLFSIYLTYLEPFVIGAVCAWCLSSAVIMTLLLLLTVETAVPALAEK